MSRGGVSKFLYPPPLFLCYGSPAAASAAVMDGGYTGQDTKRERIQVPCVETQEGWGGFEKGGRVVHKKKKKHMRRKQNSSAFLL